MKTEDLYLQFDNIFFEKTRLSMLTLLYREETVSFNRFKKLLGGTDGALYSHLKKLIESNYIISKKTIMGNSAETQYSFTKQGKASFKKYLAFLENMVIENKKGD
ncbi:MAG: transcriptional regulator [Spirochaetales bacterium]|nr:transcriptional regulator [Spirochaetales bacterium]